MNQRRLVQIAIGLAVIVVFALALPRGEEQDTTTPAPPAVQSDAPVAPLDGPKPVNADTQASTEHGNFDYYVLVLSWSPTHCASNDGRGSDDDLQCRGGRPFGFVLHGLWPQHERGYPQDCPSDEPRVVADGLMAKMLEISPSEKLVQHEWVKHGTCSGLRQSEYFAKAAKAFGDVAMPLSYFN